MVQTLADLFELLLVPGAFHQSGILYRAVQSLLVQFEQDSLLDLAIQSLVQQEEVFPDGAFDVHQLGEQEHQYPVGVLHLNAFGHQHENVVDHVHHQELFQVRHGFTLQGYETLLQLGVQELQVLYIPVLAVVHLHGTRQRFHWLQQVVLRVEVQGLHQFHQEYLLEVRFVLSRQHGDQVVPGETSPDQLVLHSRQHSSVYGQYHYLQYPQFQVQPHFRTCCTRLLYVLELQLLDYLLGVDQIYQSILHDQVHVYHVFMFVRHFCLHYLVQNVQNYLQSLLEPVAYWSFLKKLPFTLQQIHYEYQKVLSVQQHFVGVMEYIIEEVTKLNPAAGEQEEQSFVFYQIREELGVSIRIVIQVFLKEVKQFVHKLRRRPNSLLIKHEVIQQNTRNVLRCEVEPNPVSILFILRVLVDDIENERYFRLREMVGLDVFLYIQQFRTQHMVLLFQFTAALFISHERETLFIHHGYSLVVVIIHLGEQRQELEHVVFQQGSYEVHVTYFSGLDRIFDHNVDHVICYRFVLPFTLSFLLVVYFTQNLQFRFLGRATRHSFEQVRLIDIPDFQIPFINIVHETEVTEQLSTVLQVSGPFLNRQFHLKIQSLMINVLVPREFLETFLEGDEHRDLDADSPHHLLVRISIQESVLGQFKHYSQSRLVGVVLSAQIIEGSALQEGLQQFGEEIGEVDVFEVLLIDLPVLDVLVDRQSVAESVFEQTVQLYAFQVLEVYFQVIVQNELHERGQQVVGLFEAVAGRLQEHVVHHEVDAVALQETSGLGEVHELTHGRGKVGHGVCEHFYGLGLGQKLLTAVIGPFEGVVVQGPSVFDNSGQFRHEAEKEGSDQFLVVRERQPGADEAREGDSAVQRVDSGGQEGLDDLSSEFTAFLGRRDSEVFEVVAVTDGFGVGDDVGGDAGLILLLTVVETQQTVDVLIITDEVFLGQSGVHTVSVGVLQVFQVGYRLLRVQLIFFHVCVSSLGIHSLVAVLFAGKVSDVVDFISHLKDQQRFIEDWISFDIYNITFSRYARRGETNKDQESDHESHGLPEGGHQLPGHHPSVPAAEVRERPSGHGGGTDPGLGGENRCRGRTRVQGLPPRSPSRPGLECALHCHQEGWQTAWRQGQGVLRPGIRVCRDRGAERAGAGRLECPGARRPAGHGRHRGCRRKTPGHVWCQGRCLQFHRRAGRTRGTEENRGSLQQRPVSHHLQRLISIRCHY